MQMAMQALDLAFSVNASVPPSPHLLPPISWIIPPSKSRLIGLSGYPFCFLPFFTEPLCEFHCFIKDLQFSASLYTLIFQKGQYSQGGLPCIKAQHSFPHYHCYPSCRGQVTVLGKNTFKYAETMIFVHIQFLRTLSTKQNHSSCFSRLLKAWHPTPSHSNTSGVMLPSSYRSSTFVRKH